MKQNNRNQNLKRLKRIKDYIYPARIIMDIGCDHGYLIKLAFDDEKTKIIKAYAVDNKNGPLNQAKDNLIEYDNVIYLLQDGLSTFYDDVDCVIIAGMGGDLIIRILNDFFNKTTINHNLKFILEANKHSEKVREFMFNNGFIIDNESIIYEDNKYYEIDSFVKGNIKYNDYDIMFGPINLKERNKEFIDKWNNLLIEYKKIVQKIDDNNDISSDKSSDKLNDKSSDKSSDQSIIEKKLLIQKIEEVLK